jgi:hypothetical protein
MKALQDVTMQEKQQLKRFFIHDCGGIPFIRMLKNFVRLVMFSKELGSLPGEMRCH